MHKLGFFFYKDLMKLKIHRLLGPFDATRDLEKA